MEISELFFGFVILVVSWVAIVAVLSSFLWALALWIQAIVNKYSNGTLYLRSLFLAVLLVSLVQAIIFFFQGLNI